MPPAAIGPFKIERELGRGGMGEVYLARDTRLDRQVAIKALPAHLVQDPDRLARFQREAKVLASLNHPGIGAIYGLEEADGHQHLILEFVEGETLAERLANGPVPIDEALVLAKQIAEALEAAHEKGVIHRDLKPGNVMVTPDGVVKVLDFGLARSAEGSPSSTNALGAAPVSPTLTSPAPIHSPTIPGAIMGTAGYMSPEQARGRAVDKRSDIFSFGCVFYEMLTGIMPFRGETVADAIGATLHKESDLGLLPAGTPRRVRELLTNCLAKDRKNRLHDIGDARLEIDRAMREPQDIGRGDEPARAWWRSPAVLVSAALVALAAVIGALSLRSSPAAALSERSVIRSNLAFPKGMVMPDGDRSVAVSPDGNRVVVVLYQKDAGSGPSLFLRDLSRLEFRPLPGTQDASYPFFSPDGKSIAFFAGRKLKRIDLADNVVRTLCDAPAGRGGSWGTKGTIVFAPGANGGLSIVSDSGGAPSEVTRTANASESHRVPQMLPDGQRFLYYITNVAKGGVYAFDPATKQSRLVAECETEAMFVEPSSLVFAVDENLLIQPFDLARLELTGSPTPLAPGVYWDARRASLNLGISSHGTMVYQPVSPASTAKLAWMDRKGVRTPIPVEPFPLGQVCSLAQDGRRAAVNTAGDRGESRLAVLDLERGVRTPLGDAKGTYYYGALITNDGTRVLTFDGNAQADCIVSFPSAGGTPTRLFDSTHGFEFDCSSISPDGRTLLFTKTPMRDKIGDIMTLDLGGDGVPKPFMETPEPEWSPRIAPSGGVVAYAVLNEQDQGGLLKIVTYPAPSAPVQVSLSRVSPTFGWLSKDELYWVDGLRKAWSTTVSLTTGQFDLGAPKPMFDGIPLDKQIAILDYDLARERFLIAIEHEPRDEPRLIVVSDWRPGVVGQSPAPK